MTISKNNKIIMFMNSIVSLSQKMEKRNKQKTKPKNKEFDKKDNICNICEIEGNLSKDHVPPSVCPPIKNRVTSKLLSQMIGDKAFRPRLSQNGVYYKTICEKCNNDLLGGQYDPSLGTFTKNLETMISSSLKLPQKFVVECSPNAIIRSILGHLLAAKTETDQVILDKLIRPCILDSSIPIPDDIHIFYWIYPYEKTVIFRDFVIVSMKKSSNSLGLFNLIKFYPVAFLVAYQVNSYEGLTSLHGYNQLPVYQKASIPIHLSPIREATWPEDVNKSEHSLAFGRSAQDAISSVPNIRRIKI